MTDPYFQDIPWDLIYDDNGELIGEVYTTLPDPPTRKRKNKKSLLTEARSGDDRSKYRQRHLVTHCDFKPEGFNRHEPTLL